MSSGPRSRAGRTTAIHRESAGPCAKSYPLIVSSCPSSHPACHPAPDEPRSKSSPSHHRSSAWQGLEASHVPALSHGRAVSVSGADPAAQTAARANPRFVALPPRSHERTSSHLPGPRGRRARLRGVHIGCPILLAGDACQPRAHTSSQSSVRHRGTLWISMASSGHQHVANAGAPRTRLPEKKSVSRHLAT